MFRCSLVSEDSGVPLLPSRPPHQLHDRSPRLSIRQGYRESGVDLAPVQALTVAPLPCQDRQAGDSELRP
jgi:hypothetical protein